MVRAAEGLHVRPPAADAGGSGAIDGDAVDSTAPPPDKAGAQGNLELPAERRRWNSLVSYPGDAAADGDAQSAPPSAAAQGAEAAGTPADSDEAASAAARRAAADAALERKLDAVPAEPGVYLLRDRAGRPRARPWEKSSTSARPNRSARACAPTSAKAATLASRCVS